MRFDENMGNIRDIVDSMALSRVRSFYPESIQKHIDLSLEEIVQKLEVLRQETILQLKFEVRCPNDFSALIVTDNYQDIVNKEKECPKCGYSFLVTDSSIYPKYYFAEGYREHLKKKKTNSLKMVAMM